MSDQDRPTPPQPAVPGRPDDGAGKGEIGERTEPFVMALDEAPDADVSLAASEDPLINEDLSEGAVPITQRLRDAKREQVFDLYDGREGDLVTGIVQSSDHRYAMLDLGNAEAIMPGSERIPYERLERGWRSAPRRSAPRNSAPRKSVHRRSAPRRSASTSSSAASRTYSRSRNSSNTPASTRASPVARPIRSPNRRASNARCR